MEEKVGKVIKSILKVILIPILIVCIVFIIFIGSIYTIFKGDIHSFINAQEEYKNLLKTGEEMGLSKNGDSSILNRISEIVNIQQVATIPNQNGYNRISSMKVASIQKISDQNYNLNKEIVLSQQRIAAIEIEGDDKEKAIRKSKAEEIAAGLSFLAEYIKDSPTQTKEQKLAYLMNSEVVTMYPYIESVAGDETKLNGVVKFYRYLNSIEDGSVPEKIQLTFINNDNFEKKFEDYKNSGNKDVLNYFTLDKEKNIVIAYGTIETKTITTTDNELTVEKINEISTQTYTKKEDGVYESSTYKIEKKSIDYQSYVKQYVLPFNFLATLLVQTRDYNLVKEIADLAYNSEIAIGIYDNRTTTENIEEYTYNKKIKYTENTKLVFDNIATDPVVDISSAQYSEVIKECLGKLDDTRESSIHCSGIDVGDLDTAVGNRTDGNVYEAYISEITADGKVTGITAEPHEFKTEFKVKIIGNSTPTVDIAVADIWAGKYISTYIEEENDVPAESSTYDVENEKFLNLEVDRLTDDVLRADGEIGKKLKDHSENLKSLAIKEIIKKTDFTVNPKEIMSPWIIAHAKSCEECQEILRNKYGDFWMTIIVNKEKVNEVKTLEELVTVKQHVEEYLQELANEETQRRKQNFIVDINSEGQITYNQWPTVYKANISIANNKTFSKVSSTYKKDLTVTEAIGEKFASILNNKKFYVSKQAILAREEWIWDALKDYEVTANIESLIRYLFNIAFETEDFGTFKPEDIKKIFNIFDTQDIGEKMEKTSDSDMNLLQQYVRMFENSYIFNYVYGKSDNYTDLISQYITKDRTAYYLRTDGHDHPTVGFGVDLFNGGFYDEGLGEEISFATYLMEYYGYTEAQLRDVSGKTTIPVEIVDELEEKELQEKLNDVLEMNEREGLGLEKYQIYALVSFNFNTGKMYKWGSYDSFIEMYKKHWEQEDDKHGQGETSVDYKHILYTDFLYKSRFTKNSSGEKVEVPGLIDRRKSEWKLFQTGYMDNIKKLVTDQDYPEGIRIFTIEGTKLTFPEYPQTPSAGEKYKLYADKTMGGKTKAYAGRTLRTSGCGIFAASCIVSGLQEDSSINPISYIDNLDEYYPKGEYYVVGSGGTWDIWNNKFLQKYYGLNSISCSSESQMKKIFEQKNGKCGAIVNEGGHYVAVLPIINEEGKCKSFYVIDSVGKHTGEYKSASEYISRNTRKNPMFTICGIIY